MQCLAQKSPAASAKVHASPVRPQAATAGNQAMLRRAPVLRRDPQTQQPQQQAQQQPQSPPPQGAPAGAAKTPAPAGPCTLNCTDAAFTALNPAAREAKLTADCPQGLPLVRPGTFFGQPIPGASSAKLRAKLLDAQTRAMKAMCLEGLDPTAYELDRAITTYGTHSPAEDKAVDIDVQGQPYIAHEHSSDTDKEAGERAIDQETGAVFQRIAYWSLYRKSVIPKGITTVAKPPKGGATDRTWTDPATGTPNTPTTTGELYDKLAAESDGMQKYFALLNQTDKELASEISAFNAVNTDGSVDLTKLEIPGDESDASVQAFRKRIASDYLILGGSKAQLKDFAGDGNAGLAKAPTSHPGDRPFQGGALADAASKGGRPLAAANRRPELGFISLPKEVVVALTEVGLVWGAVDFGDGSGDVMHFDCRTVSGC